MEDFTDTSTSGYIFDSFEGISPVFTDIHTIRISGYNVVSHGKRYGRRWLLKSLTPQTAGEEQYRQRMRKELEIMLDLQHPSVVSAVGIENVEGLGRCIVMEYVDGLTLNEWLATRPSLKRRRRVTAQIIDAVGYIHAKGVVHRDLKPSNILISHNGENVKIIDFGLADTDSHDVLKQPAGTPRYMSEEQKELPVADVRNDIYSLGMVFRDLRPRYGHIVGKCLKPAESRYQNISELKKDIERSRRLPVIIGIIAALIFITALTYFIIFIFSPKPVDSIPLETDLKDSVRNQTESPSSSSTETTASLPVEPRETVPGRKSEVEKTEETAMSEISVNPKSSEFANNDRNDPKVMEEVKKGRAAVRKVFAEMEIIRHIDTLTDLRYLRSGLDYDRGKYAACLENFENRLKAESFTTYQQAIVSDEMMKEAEKIKNEYSRKLMQLKK